jgi:translocation and assembly module TamB
MSERKPPRADLREPDAPARPPRRKWSRLRRFFFRHLPLSIAGLVILAIFTAIGAYFYMSSARFENLVRGRLVAEIERLTGGQVEIASFHWRLLDLEADMDGLVIHGLEAPEEAPYAQIDHVRVDLSLLGFISPRILLNDLEIDHPQVHFIVYPDGLTNQPQPLKPRKPGESTLDRLFDLRAGRVTVAQGLLDYDNRAAAFDFQNRHAPLDFTASDVSLAMSYIAAQNATPETFHIEAGARDLVLTRTVPRAELRNEPLPVHGLLHATLDLTRNAAYLRSFALTAHSRDGADHTLRATGTLRDFSRPVWQAKLAGDFDMRLLDPITGYNFAPEGLARLDLDAAGSAGEFRIDGPVHVDNGAYIGTGVYERGIQLDSQVHADPSRLLITSISARLHQGGSIEGTVDLAHWLPQVPGESTLQGPPSHAVHAPGHQGAPVHTAVNSADLTIPVDGKVTANFKNVSLDTILDMVSQPPFQRLGIASVLNGTATATWVKGDANTVAVDGLLGLTPPTGAAPAQEAPASGAIDATYTQRDGAVAVRNLALQLPQSALTAHGLLGAYPLTSPTALSVDFHSGNFSEFDTVLRALGLKRNGRSGAAALPVALSGQADFFGAWAGSLIHPHLSGHLKSTDLGIEMPPAANAPSVPRYVHLDSLEADGSYASARIAVLNAVARRGRMRVVFGGTLDAADTGEPGNNSASESGNEPAGESGFDADSTLTLHAQAENVAMDDVQPFLGRNLPVTGTFSAQFQASGPVRNLGGTGSVVLEDGSVWGEPVSLLRAQGTLANQVWKVSTASVTAPAGVLAGSGSYDVHAGRFDVQASSAGIDMARIDWLRRNDVEVAGRLALTVSGSGTLDDPRLEGHAELTSLALAGEQFGEVDLTAHTTGRTLNYGISTHFAGAEFSMKGQTAMNGEYPTQAQLNFSHFDIGALLKLAHVESINGESALAGNVTVAGPLRHPEQLHGEARLEELSATLAGVKLESEGGVHATLEDARVHLDPLHITGENTDLRMQGDLTLKDARQLDLTASGSVNLKLAETLDPDLTASGTSTFQVEAHGPLKNPGLRGRIDFENSSLSLEDLPNGLSQLHGTLQFNQNRLDVTSLTAMSGGGLISVGGSLSYQRGIYANLTVTGKGIRIRYPQGVSSLADATLRLEGPQTNLLLSGNVLITRFTASSDLDLAALAALAGAVHPVTAPDAPSNHVRLDVRVASSPQLNFQNAFAKLAGDVDLRLRGTLATPSLLGRVSVTEGSANIAGTRYDLQRGDIDFTNPVRIEPVIDLTATAHVEDYDITLGLHGTPEKMAVTYRSDPPLPESDVVALLALGHTESQQRLYTQQQEQALNNPTTDALLGGALNATVSSRVQKLFGAGSVKIDPNYLGAFGNSTSRITVQEQLGRNVILTYATDVNTTGQQLLQAEVAINRHVSLVVARDESGVFSMVIKATRRYP